MQESLKAKGSFMATLRHSDGSVEVRRKDNLILDVGFDFIANAIGASSNRPDAMSYTAIGTGSTTVSASQTGLSSELTRKNAVYNHIAGTKVLTFTTTFGRAEGVGAVTEAGICNASSGGIFIDRVVFAPINKATEDTLTTTFQFTLT